MIKLIKIASQTNMLQVDLGDGKGPIYGSCSPEVKKFALDNLQPGNEVDILYEKKAGSICITKIGKVGTLGASTAQKAPEVVASPEKGTTEQVKQPPQTGNYRAVSPDVQTKIIHQSVMSSACNAVNCIQSQVPPEKLGDYIIELYRKLLAEVNKD